MLGTCRWNRSGCQRLSPSSPAGGAGESDAGFSCSHSLCDTFWKNPNFDKEATEFQIQSPLSALAHGQIEAGLSAMKASMRTEAGALFTACTSKEACLQEDTLPPVGRLRQRILLSTGMRLTHESE